MEFNATFIVSIISFILFIIVMNKIFYAPITKIVEEREEQLKNNYDDANWFSSAAKSIMKIRDEKIIQTEHKSQRIIADEISTYNAKSKEAAAAAAKKSAEEIKARKDALQMEKHQASLELKSKTQELAELISTKIMEQNSHSATKESDGVK